MKLLWIFLILPTVFSQDSFGRSYMKSSRLCHQWDRLNKKLGLPDALPPKDQFTAVFKSLLPQGSWQGVVDTIVQTCYENRTRRYTNTCPGQALWQCTVEQMIDNCVEDSWRKDDSCSPVTSLAGLKYMFSQSMYIDMEKNLPTERRPVWFLKNYFNSKCCNLPELFSPPVLAECGFNAFMNYYLHGPIHDTPVQDVTLKTKSEIVSTPSTESGIKLRIVDLPQERTENPIESSDPLDCCDMSAFVQPSWRSECNFDLSWEAQERLVVRNDTVVSTEAPTTPSHEPKDLMLLPNTCEKETCVFTQLNLITAKGTVDRTAFSKLLDNFTAAHPSWVSAKARVVTKCLTRDRLQEYGDQTCDVNKVLACTFDVLTENCPYTKRSDACKHHKNKSSCQISTSKYRPKNRRAVCILPELIHRDHLVSCGLKSLGRVEFVSEPKRKKHGWSSSKYACKNPTPSTLCLMNKMNIKNKYNFLDYFKMKDRIRQFTEIEPEWSGLSEVYLSAITNMPMYGEHCSSSRKLLNVLDSMMITCPISKRKNTPQCQKIFSEMTNTAPLNKNITQQNAETILKHFHQVYLPETPVTSKYSRTTRHRRPKVQRKPIYNYGLLDSKSSPKVKVVDLKPKNKKIATEVKIPAVILPVYLRPILDSVRPFNYDGILRSNSLGPANIGGHVNKNAIPTKVVNTEAIVDMTPIEMMKPLIYAK